MARIALRQLLDHAAEHRGARAVRPEPLEKLARRYAT